jgi:hypothetical protein
MLIQCPDSVIVPLNEPGRSPIADPPTNSARFLSSEGSHWALKAQPPFGLGKQK